MIAHNKKMKWMVINFFRFFIYYSGCAFLLSLISKKGVIILTYHRINNVTDAPSLAVSLETFEQQIKYLALRKKVISLEELVTNIQKGIKFPKRCAVITFDDGYKDNYTNAYPILKKYSMPFTIFLATDYIGSDEMKWDDELEYKIKQSDCELLALKTNYSKRYSLIGEKEKKKAFDDLFKLLIGSNKEKRKEILSELDNELKVEIAKQDIENTMLSWEDVKEMAIDTNVSFGAHTCSHCKLTSLSQEDVREEIEGSKRIIEKKNGKKINFFSYPYGGRNCYNERIKQISKETGFDCAVTTIYGKNNLESDLFELRRIGVNDSLWLFKYNLMCIGERFHGIYYKIFKKSER